MEECEGWKRPCTMYVKKQQGQLVDVICQINGKMEYDFTKIMETTNGISMHRNTNIR